MKQIIWLTSYPKSGNTWFRALLANYFSNSEEEADINSMGNSGISSARPVFDEHLGVAASDLTFAEVTRLRPKVYQFISDTSYYKKFIKVHDGYIRSAAGDPIFPADATHATIYLVRNPLDVCLSYANHNDCSVDRAIALMADHEHQLAPRAGNLPGQLPQRMGSWSDHVKGWLDQKELPIHLIKYEDLKLDASHFFEKAIVHMGFDLDPKKLEKAVTFTQFDRLKKQELESGFTEKPIKAPSFFREGRAGGWRGSLSREQWEKVRSAHQEVMERLGYWDEPFPEPQA